MASTGSISQQNLLADLNRAIQHVQNHGGWTVLLTPSHGVALAASCMMSAMIPADASFSGRTARFTNGWISVASADQEPFIPEDEPFWMRFLGWANSDATTGVQAWQSRSLGVLRLV